MTSSDSGDLPHPWRKDVYTFADENQRIFTVTNCPPIIYPLPITSNDDNMPNPSSGCMSRLRISIRKYPELAFMLHKLPMADPLLARICVDPNGLQLMRFQGGWALKEDVRHSWIALEKGLLHISELLLTSTHESSAGTSARYGIRDHEHWPPPQDYGYQDVHSSASAAVTSIRLALGAFHVLVARCSLAITLWQFPGPIKGKITAVSNMRYDPVMAAVVPEWVVHLRALDVPSSWIDAICRSVITDFSLNMRVGTVFDPTECPWIKIAPVLKGANIPVFVLWHSPTAVQQCIATYPFMTIFAPSVDDAMQARAARHNPPYGRPRVVVLCRNASSRLVPDYSGFDDTTPPFGPYQLPGESRTEFFARRERYRQDQTRRESLMQRERHRIRETDANSGAPPNRRSRVYLWVTADLVFQDLPPHWNNYKYRFPMPPAAYRSLWMVHAPSLRAYNAFYDEWDLWFPAGWNLDGDSDLSAPTTGTFSPRSETRSSWDRNQVLHDEYELLIPSPEDREMHDLDQPLSFILHSWYGIHIASTRTFSGVDYEKWGRDIWHTFGETRERFPTDLAIKKCMSGWVYAVMQRDWTSHALGMSWDLDPRHPNYILGSQSADPRLSVSLNHVKSHVRKDDPDNTARWVVMKFHADPLNQPWSLLTSPLGALMIIRRFPEATTSADALHSLICAGIPARTGAFMMHASPKTASSPPELTIRHVWAPWRRKGDRPTIQDYDNYCQRVLELSASPHVRAAWLKGGIVWRIMVEVTGKHPNAHMSATHLEELQNGPSAKTSHHEAVTESSNDGEYYDDTLSVEELNILAGVVRVYTGRGDQTEDASWWPKHSAWTRAAGHTGIWSPGDEEWFQRRLKAIYEGNEGPLNASEWKNKLRRQKKAGTMWKVLDEWAWDFTHRHFVRPLGPGGS